VPLKVLQAQSMKEMVRFDISSLIGLGIAVLAIVVGLKLEGGHLSSMLQPTAALVVLGGTLGAVVAQFPLSLLRRLLTDLRRIVVALPTNRGLLNQLLGLASKARRDGLVALDPELAKLDEFLRRGLELAVDGGDPRAVRETMELALDHFEDEREQSIKVLESAGGYAPTVGILGAVLGLIHVMENLSQPSHLGSGIAVAFVSTVYGVGFANLIVLPLAGRLRARLRADVARLELALEGAVAIAARESPRVMARRLSVYIAHEKRGAAHGGERGRAREDAERVRSAA
jgi:chemotaxis protein MotA